MPVNLGDGTAPLVSGGIRSFTLVQGNNPVNGVFYSVASSGITPTDSGIFSTGITWLPNSWGHVASRLYFSFDYDHSTLNGKTPSHLILDDVENAITSTTVHDAGRTTYIIQPYTLANPAGPHTIDLKFDDGTRLYGGLNPLISKMYFGTTEQSSTGLVSGGVRSGVFIDQTNGQYLVDTFSPPDSNIGSLRWFSMDYSFIPSLQNTFQFAYLTSILGGRTASKLLIDGVENTITNTNTTEVVGNTLWSVNNYILSDPTGSHSIDLLFTDGTLLFGLPMSTVGQNIIRAYFGDRGVPLVSGGVRTVTLSSLGSGNTLRYVANTTTPADTGYSPATIVNPPNPSDYGIQWFPDTWIFIGLHRKLRIMYTTSVLEGKTPSHVVVDDVEIEVTGFINQDGVVDSSNNPVVYITSDSFDLANPTGPHTIDLKFDDGTRLYGGLNPLVFGDAP